VQTSTKLYRVELRLDRSEGTSPAWIVAGVRAKYGRAEVVRVDSYGGGKATIILRSASSDLPPSPGDQITPFSETLQVPSEALPTGIVQQVSEIDLVQGGAAESIESSLGTEQKTALRLVTAAGILVAVWFLAGRVRSS
jgi:hypothetical protein